MEVAIIRGQYQVTHPDVYLRNLVIVARAHGINAYLCTFDDFNFEKNKVDGSFFDNGEWINREFSFPSVIDNILVNKNNAEILNKLSKYTLVMNHRIGSKSSMYPFLKNDPAFKPYFIPTVNVTSKQQILEMLNEYGSVIIKPGNGRLARGIVKIYKEDEGFKTSTVIDNSEQDNHLDNTQFDSFLNNLSLSSYVCQPLIDTTTDDGNPFHVRMLVRKNEMGRFELVKSYVEIGVLNKVVSNMHVGGGLVWLDTLIDGLYPEKPQKLLHELNEMSTTLPQAFQDHYSYSISALGIDVAIDKDGHPWVMEVNAGPGHEYVKLEDLELRVRTYVYLCRQAKDAKSFSNSTSYETAADIKRYL
ncbi:YheC/YheD family protein [Paucilactobacillus suebicus]|uniref:ATP-grasp domain-containing protein n=1 Tax=Paucilactobacillus suebicus DSM 5007 = KCTC 3549 TaxID=1423807 RepID=A0A0R1W380_9LACO|nr:YheC/YheD family protein [Paucilactobacillus suebicus]KRM12021.1 hypothetical protein FD16_GL000390 [Paucilactobacillus suebicus DSM 5007 = KCTC 3549]